jgi:hypothetical protein
MKVMDLGSVFLVSVICAHGHFAWLLFSLLVFGCVVVSLADLFVIWGLLYCCIFMSSSLSSLFYQDLLWHAYVRVPLSRQA